MLGLRKKKKGQHVMSAGKQIKFTFLTSLCPIVSCKRNILRAFLFNLFVGDKISPVGPTSSMHVWNLHMWVQYKAP